MPAKPSVNPTWDTNDTDTRNPLPAEEADGFQTNALPKQLVNGWWKNTGDWIRWLFQSVLRADDIFADQGVEAHRNGPSTGSGLGPVSAGDFSARVYINGYAVGPVDGPAHTYADDSDTYWDLDEDGVWTPVVVTSGDPEPAVTANAVRCYRLRTASGNRDLSSNYIATRLVVDQELELSKLMQMGLDGIVQKDDGSSVRIAIYRNELSNGLIQPGGLVTGMREIAIYYSRTGGSGQPYEGPGFEIAINARWSGLTSTWIPFDGLLDSYLFAITQNGIFAYVHPAAGSSFLDQVGSSHWREMQRLRKGCARGVIQTGPSPSISDEVNVSAVVTSGNAIRVTLDEAMPDADYYIEAHSPSTNFFVTPQIVDATEFLLFAFDGAGGAVEDLSTTSLTIRFRIRD